MSYPNFIGASMVPHTDGRTFDDFQALLKCELLEGSVGMTNMLMYSWGLFAEEKR